MYLCSIFHYMRYHIYTDGSVEPNPGSGGWAFVAVKDKLEINYGFARDTTNNRMELIAVINALESTEVGDKVKIYCDSQYVCKGYNLWMYWWRDKKWSGVANVDLWKQMYELSVSRPKVEVHWIKGHSTHTYNIMADIYAGKAREMEAFGYEERDCVDNFK